AAGRPGRRGPRAARPGSLVLLLGPAGEPAGVLLGVVRRARGIPPARLVGARHGKVAIDLDVDEGRPARRERPADGRLDLVRVRGRLAVDPERRADGLEVRRVDRA